MRIAVAMVHDVGKPRSDLSSGFARLVAQRAAQESEALGCPPPDLVFEPVYWSPLVQEREDELWRRVAAGRPDAQPGRRHLFAQTAAALAYLAADGRVYDQVHATFALALKKLAIQAGPAAPLAVVARGMGSVVASHFLYDLQAAWGPHARPDAFAPLPEIVHDVHGPNPSALERGETLAQLHTLGSPLALWGVRAASRDPATDYGLPLQVPTPELARHHPALAQAGPGAGWTNFHDPADALAFPLRGLNPAHQEAVQADVEVPSAPGAHGRPTPEAAYWTHPVVTDRIGASLAHAWSTLHTRRVRVQEALPQRPA